jgi:hypothetical protein
MLCTSGVENDKDVGGFDTIYGKHSASIHGRVYTFIPSVSTSQNHFSALSSFIFDCLDGVDEHGVLFTKSSGEQSCINPEIAKRLFNVIKETNPFAQSVRFVAVSLCIIIAHCYLLFILT